MDIEKLKETLLANGVDEETADKVIADLEKPDDEEPKVDEEGKAEEELPPSTGDDKGDDESESDDEDGKDSEEGELPPDEVVPPVQEEELPPEEVAPEVPPVEQPLPEELPPELPPVEDPLPPAPEFDPTELLGKVDEQKATIEGLLSRIDSLEDALKKAGILDASDGEEVGLDNPNVPPTNPGAIDEYDDALAILNGKKHY